MNFRVIVQPRAEAELAAAYEWITERSPGGAAGWLDGLQTAIDSLEAYPRRCPSAPENDAFEEEVRQLLYGRRHGIYRVVFLIRDNTVYILTIRHGARQPLAPEE